MSETGALKKLKSGESAEDEHHEEEPEKKPEAKGVQLDCLRNRVFDQELLLQKIVSIALANQPSDVVNLRRVSKAWLQALAKSCKKSRIPLFHFKVTNIMQYGRQISGATECLLFLEKLKKSQTARLIDNQLPPIKLEFEDPNSFLAENHDIFGEILQRASTNLVDLSLAVPADGGSMPFIFPKHIVLPNLREISVRVVAPDEDAVTVFGYVNVTYLIQSMFDMCKDLRQVNLIPEVYNFRMPPGSSHWAIPDTVTTLKLNFSMFLEHSEMLFRNSLPVLEHLEIVIGDPAIKGENIAKILEKFQKTLKRFSLDTQYLEVARGPIELIIPPMEKLENFEIGSDRTTLGDNPNLEQNLPNLKTLELLGLSIPVTRKWLVGRKFESVEVLLFSPKRPDTHPEPLAEHAFGPDVMDLFHLAFPNVTKMQLSVDGYDVHALPILFEKMTNLISLAILIRDTRLLQSSEIFDSLLTGFTSQEIEAWKQDPEAPLPQKQPCRSIKNLENLSRLCLDTIDNDQPATWMEVSLISNTAFELAFVKMLNLQEIQFSGRFKASTEMAQTWINLGRKLGFIDNL